MSNKLCVARHDEIIGILGNIFNTLSLDKEVNNGLYEGSGGHLLFKAFYHKHIGLTPAHNLEETLNEWIGSIADINKVNLCDGIVSVYWILTQLEKWELLNESDTNFIRESYSLMNKCAMEMAQDGNFDFLYGSLGISTFLHLFEDKKTVAAHFQEILLSIERHLIGNETGMVQSYDITNACIRAGVVDLGLAHGIPSILKFCLIAHHYEECSIQAEKLARSIIDYLIRQADSENRISYFGNNNLGDENVNSRLAWCYGDLGIAFTLYQAGNFFSDERLVEFSLSVIDKTLLRRDTTETYHCDASLCHGTSGIAHIYYKMHLATGKHDYQDAASYWIEETLRYLSVENDLVYATHTSKTYTEKHTGTGLLNGLAGIGLVLLSYLTGDCSWDSCIMLQDV